MRMLRREEAGFLSLRLELVCGCLRRWVEWQWNEVNELSQAVRSFVVVVVVVCHVVSWCSCSRLEDGGGVRE